MEQKLELKIDGVQYNFNISFDFFSNDLQRISKFCSKVSDEHHFQQCNEELTKRVDNALLLYTPCKTHGRLSCFNGL